MLQKKQTREVEILFTGTRLHFNKFYYSNTSNNFHFMKLHNPQNTEALFKLKKCPVVTKREEFINIKTDRDYLKENEFNFTLSDKYFSGKQRLLI